MSPKQLVINTADKPALYPNIEIEINGTKYQAKRSTRPMWRTLRELEQRIKAGDFTAYYEQIEIMTNAPQEAVDTLDIGEVKQIIEYIIERCHNPEAGMDETEKKAFPPGAKKRAESPAPSPASSKPEN